MWKKPSKKIILCKYDTCEYEFIPVELEKDGHVLDIMGDDDTLSDEQRYGYPVVFLHGDDLLSKFQARLFSNTYYNDWPVGRSCTNVMNRTLTK